MTPLFIDFASLLAVLAAVCILDRGWPRRPLVLPKGWAEDLARAFDSYDIGRPEPSPERGDVQWEVVDCEDDASLQHWVNSDRFVGWTVHDICVHPGHTYTLVLTRPADVPDEDDY